ncbi:MAG TPA: DUF3375 domain-containing protein [Saprospiraceae bacterium]|nr:DUF3375 domain-containing protein [Saprospiraceae bacterium]
MARIDFSKVEDVDFVLSQNKAVRLLRKEHAPLIVAFLWSSFKEQHRQTYPASELTTRLSDLLFSINNPEPRFPRPARYYLEVWTQEGFLRQYYEEQAVEATFELTPATERALLWITELEQGSFVGAESRLLQVFQLLRELAMGTTEDKNLRLEQLQEEKARLEREIEALENDELQRLDSTRVREQYFLIEEASAKLLSDFRQIEENFRLLNAQAREEQITKAASRGAILDDIFDAQDAILETDQGRTFNAFWSFLMNQQRQDELDEWTRQLFLLPELEQLRRRSAIPRLKMSLVAAGDRVNQTTDRLVEQLRRFLQSRAVLENKRVAQIITEIEQLAIRVKSEPPGAKQFFAIEHRPDIHLVMDRGPYEPPQVPRLKTRGIELGQGTGVLTTALYEQLYIDPAELRGRIKTLLRGRDQISLQEVIETIPIEKGLSELVAYFSIATDWEGKQKAVINRQRRQRLLYTQAEETYSIDLPETIFIA